MRPAEQTVELVQDTEARVAGHEFREFQLQEFTKEAMLPIELYLHPSVPSKQFWDIAHAGGHEFSPDEVPGDE